MKQKIALIQPNSPFLIDERVSPNIGLVRVATALQNEGHDVDLLDYSGKTQEEIITDVQEKAHDYDLYGFSSTSPQFPYAMNIFEYLKDENPDARTVLGGPHASALYHLKEKGISDINVDDLECFDTVFCGEGEETENIFKAGWHKAELQKDIDLYATPDRSFLDLDSYNYQIDGEDATTIQTQRGCPFTCTFCSGRDVDMYKTVRAHSPERVVEELDALHDEYGFSSFMWYDDEVNINANRLEELCDRLSTRDYQHRGFVRNDLIVKRPESVEWMKKAGFAKLCAGVESGSDRILGILDKKCTVDENTEARRIIGEQGIHYEAFMLMGHPSETIDDVEMTRDWLLENKPDDFDLNILTPYPGSRIYDNALSSDLYSQYSHEWNGLFFNKEQFATTDTYYKGLGRQSKSNTRTHSLSHDTLVNLRNQIEEEVQNAR